MALISLMPILNVIVASIVAISVIWWFSTDYDGEFYSIELIEGSAIYRFVEAINKKI